MNIPGNKIKDLIEVLRTVDVDATHYITKIQVTESRGRRYAILCTAADKQFFTDRFLDDLNERLYIDDTIIVEDTATMAEFKTKLIKHLKTLHETIETLQDKLDQLQHPSSPTT